MPNDKDVQRQELLLYLDLMSKYIVKAERASDKFDWKAIKVEMELLELKLRHTKRLIEKNTKEKK